MTAAPLKSLENLHRYTQEVAARRPEDDPKVQKLRLAQRTVWLFLLVCMFLCYYLLDKMGAALSLL